MMIRIAEERDAPAIARGERETAATPALLVGRPGEIPLAAYVAKIADLGPAGCYWVAEEQGRVIGHAFLDPTAEGAFLDDLTMAWFPER